MCCIVLWSLSKDSRYSSGIRSTTVVGVVTVVQVVGIEGLEES